MTSPYLSPRGGGEDFGRLTVKILHDPPIRLTNILIIFPLPHMQLKGSQFSIPPPLSSIGKKRSLSSPPWKSCDPLINRPPPSPLPERKISTCPWYAQTILKGALELDLLLFNQTASAFDI